MKRKFTFLTAALALLAFLALPMGMKGQTRDVETFTFSELGYDNAEDVTTVVGDDVTLTFDAGTNTSNSPKYYNTGSGVRMYVNNTLEVALNDQTGDTRITAIDFTFSGDSYTGGLQNWTGSETSHTFTATGTARIQVITVTFSEGGVAPTTYTVTYYANVTGTAPVVDTYIEGADVTLRDANTFTNDGYTFSEWNTQADGDGDAYEAGDVIEDIQDNIELYAIWTENAPSNDHWVLTSLSDLTANDVFVIVGTRTDATYAGNYAMSNDKGTGSAPTAVAVTIANNEITSTVAANIQWTISGNATDGYTFYPNGSTATWLYCYNNNNGLRVGTSADKTFVITSNYLYNSGQGRYIGVYQAQDWRSYTSINNNIQGQTFAFYKKVTGGVVPPSITAANVDIEYDATSGSITYTINNEVEGGTMSASTTADWITLGNNFDSPIAFTCTANEAGTARTATVTLTYTYNRETVTKDVTVTQAAAPVVYNTMQAIFDKATEVGSTATSVNIALQNWVVSGVSTNGKNVFVTDGTKGFVIYDSNGDMGFAVGNVLSGTVSCKVQLYNGFAEITELNSSTVGISIATGGIVTTAEIAMADLAGVNTSALVHYDNLTCSVSNNKYYLSDGTTTLQVYNALYAFDALTDGKTYNITGIYQQYNSTKEILPRSAEDIEEVETPIQDYDLTVEPFENLELITFVDDEMVMEEDGTVQVTEGAQVMLSIVADEGYVIETLMVNGVNHANDIEEDFTYTFTMPGENVTISATAVEYVAPTASNYVRITSLDQLTDGSKVIIAARHNATVYSYYAMKNATSGKPEGTLFTSMTSGNDEVVTSTITDDEDNYYWTVNVTENGYTFTNAEGQLIGYSSSTNFATGGNNTEWTIERSTAGESTMVPGYTGFVITNVNIDNRAFAFNGTTNHQFGAYSTSNMTAGGYNFFLDFFVQSEAPVTETYTLEITGYTNFSNPDGGYYLIASPVTVNPADVEGMTEGSFDLYYFDEAEDNNEWQNWKDNDETGHFNLVPGKGYLYAHQEGGEFELTGTPYTGDGTITLNKTNGTSWSGWNLVGNPFGETAYIQGGDWDFYVMNQDGLDLEPAEVTSIGRMQGIFVVANSDGEQLTLTTEAPTAPQGGKIVVNVRSSRGNNIDRAMIRFGEGRQLPKFQLNPDNTKLYIAQEGEDFAVVRSIDENSTPVSFRAAENGIYTLSVNADNIEMEYLHLIDNMTGNDIDLLATPSYTFEARTTDYADRFNLVYATCDDVNENNMQPFAFFNGSEWVINNAGNALLQVVDVTGRVISSETLNGNAHISLDQVPGVYVMRLVSGNNVKVQKVIIK